MRDWHLYWTQRPARYGSTDFCEQVGRTSQGGKAIPPGELRRAVAQARVALRLRSEDRLLDLCCGNGLLTVRMAGYCRTVTGVDYSRPMLEIAGRHHSRPNVRYVEGSVLDLAALAGEPQAPFEKAVMFESFQRLRPADLPLLLCGLAAIAKPGAILYLTGVLDAERIWAFYDTPERRMEYERAVAEGREAMGNSWRWSELVAVLESRGQEPEILEQDLRLNTSSYRFDVRLEVR